MNQKSLRRIFAISASALAAIAFLQSCDDNPIASSTSSIIEGKVVQAGTFRPIDGVLVRSSRFSETTLTGSDGSYELTVQLPDSATVLTQLLFSKEGYFETSLTLVIQNGERTLAPQAVMTQIAGPPTTTSGPASNIVLLEASENRIFVKHSGAPETSNLTFEVRDASGVPVDLDHKEQVKFRVLSGPDGGEFVSPDTMSTDFGGRVVTTLNSGTVSGPVQVVAEIGDGAIHSDPIPVTISGWLPDQAHFDVVPQKVNIAGIRFSGILDPLTAFIGDRFSNPVPPLTTVWFETTGGIVDGAAVTDLLGRATVTLLSANPRPLGVDFNSLRLPRPGGWPDYFGEVGFALIRARTVDENSQFIYAENVVLFSGTSRITDVNPTTFDLGPFGVVDINFTVSDENRNPLVEGTTIKVTSNEGEVSGATDVTLDDTRSRGATFFSVRLTNSEPATLQGPTPTTITIDVGGTNGDASVSLFGTLRIN